MTEARALSRQRDTPVRVRAEFKAVLEYDAYPGDYGTEDPDEIVEIDQKSAEEDVYMFLDNEAAVWEVKVSRVAA